MHKHALTKLAVVVICVLVGGENLAAFEIKEHGHIWMVKLSSPETEVTAVVMHEALGSIPKAGFVFKTIAELLVAADAAGGFKGTETFGVGGVVVVTLPPSNLWEVIEKKTSGEGSEEDEMAAVYGLAIEWLTDNKDVDRAMTKKDARRAIQAKLGIDVDTVPNLVELRPIGDRKVLTMDKKDILKTFFDEHLDVFEDEIDRSRKVTDVAVERARNFLERHGIPIPPIPGHFRH